MIVDAIRMFPPVSMHFFMAQQGGKWQRLGYRYGGKRKTLSLGTYPDVSIV